MDFSNRSTQPQNGAPGATSASVGGTSQQVGGNGRKNNDKSSKWLKIGFVAFIVLVAIVVLGAIGMAMTSGGKDEQKYVDESRLQAVFLSTGQVYFGNIKEITPKNFVLTNIYYLQTSSTGAAAATADTSVSLVKLGCELHSPFDQMLINRTQITFWENLQDNGQVAKAVKTFKTQNPGGQKCTDASTAPTTGGAVQGAKTPAATTKP